MAKTARRQLGGRHLLFGEYLWSWTNIEDELNIDAGKHILAMFLNQKLFQFNAINKAINELGGCYPPQPIINTLLDLLNSSYPTQLHSLIIAKYWRLSEQGFSVLASQEGISITK